MSTLAAKQVSETELHRTAEFVRSLPEGSPVAVLLQNAVEALMRGQDVTLLAKDQELSPAQVAQLLNVSRPYVTKLMDRGLLEFRHVGSHRRIAVPDLLDYVSRHERANAKVQELLGTREHLLQKVQDDAAVLDDADVAALNALSE